MVKEEEVEKGVAAPDVLGEGYALDQKPVVELGRRRWLSWWWQWWQGSR